jgi:hypothetical protein
LEAAVRIHQKRCDYPPRPSEVAFDVAVEVVGVEQPKGVVLIAVLPRTPEKTLAVAAASRFPRLDSTREGEA